MILTVLKTDVIKTADYIIDLGPEGGDRGGEDVTAGPQKKYVELRGLIQVDI